MQRMSVPAEGAGSPLFVTSRGGAPSTPFPERASLLCLPRELRDEIWKAVLTADYKLSVTINAARGCYDLPQLLYTSKQVRQEVSKIFYDMNVFSISRNRCREWLEVFLPSTMADKIRVELLDGSFAAHSLWAKRTLLRNTEKLTHGIDNAVSVEFVVHSSPHGRDRFVTLAEVDAMVRGAAITKRAWMLSRGLTAADTTSS